MAEWFLIRQVRGTRGVAPAQPSTSSWTPRSCRVKLPNCDASSELFVSASGTPEFSAVETVR